MHPFALLSLSLLTAASTTRVHAQDPQPSRVVPATGNAAWFRLPGAGDAPLVDVLPDGTIWVGVEDYKAGFDRRGATFVPFLGSDAPHDWPATFRACRVTVAGMEIACTDAAPARIEGAVQFARGGVIERYLLRGDGLEQTFGFETLPERGEIVVTVGVDTQMEVGAFGDGHRFACPNGSFEYGAAMARDAAGNSLPLPTRWTGNAFEISVPESFVATATLPLWIDPLLHASHSYAPSSREVRTPDIAWDSVLRRGCVCWERVFSATDSDVYVAFCDVIMFPVGSVQTIDFTTDNWHGARVAGALASNARLVVAQVELAAGGASAVHARRVTGTDVPVVDAPVLIANNASHPDVGGVNSIAGTAPFMVVFEYQFLPSDHDIRAQAVDQAGAKQGTMISVDISAAFEEYPEVSKACGDGPASTAGWAIAYRRHTGVNVGDMRVAFLQTNGAVRTHNGNSTFLLQSQVPLTEMSWGISSPTHDSLGRNQMFAMQLPDGNGHIDLRHLLVSSTGAILAATSSRRTFNYGKLDIDSDGCRFVLAYEVLDANTGSAQSIQLETFAQIGSVMTSQDLVALPGSLHPHPAPRVAARHDGIDSEYGVVWAEMPSANSWQVSIADYSGVQAGPILNIRTTSCGAPSIYTVLTVGTYLGGSVILDASQYNNGFVGWFLGLPASTPLGICPGCTLGTDLSIVLTGPLHQFAVPCDGNLVGGTLSVQPYLLTQPAPGLCLGNIVLGDTADMIFR